MHISGANKGPLPKCQWVNQLETPGRDNPKPEIVLTKCRTMAGAVQDGSCGAFALEVAEWLGQLV